MFSLFLLSACFRGFFSEQPKYQATEYHIDTPRIVAVRNHPLELVSGEPMLIDALLLAPKGSTIGPWKASVCGLSRSVRTIIWNVACFEDTEEVTTLASSTELPLQFAIPSFPEMQDCGDEIEEDDTGWWEETDCAHYLPTLMETTVDGTPVYAVTFSSWYPTAPSNRMVPLEDFPIGLYAPQTASPGEEVELRVEVHEDLRYANFHWYIDAGTLLGTGLTTTQEFTQPSTTHPNGISISTNRLVIPEDFQGELRIWVVMHYSWGEADMVWRQTSLEVQ